MKQTVAMQKGLALVVPALLFGFLVATQWLTFEGPGSRDVAIRYVEPLNATVRDLNAEQSGLKVQLADLRRRLDELQRTAAAQSGTASELQARIDELRVYAGLSPAVGEGVVVTLDAGRPPGAPREERPPCHAPDLTDIVNAAWRGGAAAVAINGERIVASSSVYCVGATIVVNGALVSAPYQVAAVGPASPLLALLDAPDQLADLKRRGEQHVVELRISRAPRLELPAFSGPLGVRSAQPR